MRVLRHAYLNSYFQTGYKNLMDLAIIEKTEEAENQNMMGILFLMRIMSLTEIMSV